MFDVIGRVIPLALGVAMSPVPIVALLVMLLTKRARVGSIIFTIAWMAGVSTAIIVATSFAGRLPSPPRQGLDLPFEGAIAAALGVGLMIAAGLSRRGRLKAEDPAEPPTWVNAVDGISPAGGAFVAFTNATTSPKNIALTLSAGVAIQSADDPATEIVSIALFILIASLPVLIPLILYLVGGERSEATIRRWKAYVTARAAAVMEVAIFLLGIVLAVKGLANLFGLV